MSKSVKMLGYVLFFCLLNCLTFSSSTVYSEDNPMYITLLVKWERTFNPNTPNLSFKITNYDNYDFTLSRVVISNKTVWTGEFDVNANDNAELIIEDISEIFELNQFENSVEVYIEKSPNQPLFLDPIYVYNSSEMEARVTQHTLVYLEHSLPFSMPSWVEIGKNASYTTSVWNSTDFNNYTTSYLVENVSLTENIVYTNWTKVNGNLTSSKRVFYPSLGPTYFFSLTQISAIKEAPTRFGGLVYKYEKIVDLDTPLGTFETVKIKREYPTYETNIDIEDYVWVELETGLRLKRYTKYPGSAYNLTSDYIINSHLIETNVLESKIIEENKGISGFPIESVFIGVITASLILYTLKEKLSTNLH